ncbi:MAG: bla [Bacteroidetes bacterium]|jgi:beta-lactamase class A/beta-lactamase class A VEB|nr:bla [Bacteroidota bacterium]
MKQTLLFFITLTSFNLLAQVDKSSELFKTLKANDSLLFNVGFNTCDISQFEKLVSDTFEFYHDEAGITRSKAAFILSIKEGLCKLNYKPYRKLVEGSMEVYPLEKKGVMYGAIQTGKHRFYAIEKNKPERFTSVAKFTNLWLIENGQWKLSRSLSYDHQQKDNSVTLAQSIDSLKQKIQKIISEKNATVGVSIIGNNGKDTLSINGNGHYPMQSVFKFHIALVVLSKVDEGKLSLDQKIKIEKKDLLPGLYSPLRDKYPDGTTLTLSEILEYTVSQSDNVGCDILLRMIGGPKTVEDYFIKHGFKDISIKINEEVMQKNWDLQYQNWTTPKAANEVLSSFYFNHKKLLSEKSYDFLWNTMKQTQTGKKRLKGKLPENTTVAHKTGTSGANKKGLSAATNDIGIIFLPNGNHFFISVFVSNSKENEETNEKIIADISKQVWDYFTR